MFTLGVHHSHKFAVASPAVVLATIAGQTERIRLTRGVTVLSALDAVRVYQDFAQLDLAGHGRAEIIAGRSAFAEPFELFRAPMTEYDELFREKLDLLLRLREENTVTSLHSTPTTSILPSSLCAAEPRLRGPPDNASSGPLFNRRRWPSRHPAPTPGSSPPAPGGGEPGRGRGCRGSVS